MATLALDRPRVGVGPAAWLLLLSPAALLAAALGFQYLGGLHPCEMCLWQRWPHLVAIGLALSALAAPAARRPLLILAALAVLTSAGLGILHTGVERHWWVGPTECTADVTQNGDFLKTMMAAPLVRCDAPAWVFLGLSMASWNAFASAAIGLGGLALLQRHR